MQHFSLLWNIIKPTTQTQEFMVKLLLFHPEMVSTQFVWGNVFFGEELWTVVKNHKFICLPHNSLAQNNILNVYHINQRIIYQ